MYSFTTPTNFLGRMLGVSFLVVFLFWLVFSLRSFEKMVRLGDLRRFFSNGLVKNHRLPLYPQTMKSHGKVKVFGPVNIRDVIAPKNAGNVGSDGTLYVDEI